MGVTVLLSGVPNYVTLEVLSRNLDKLLDPDEIGSFRVRDIKNSKSKRYVALDFDSGFDAMTAQEILDGYRYEVPNDANYVLRAKITTDESMLPKQQSNKASSSRSDWDNSMSIVSVYSSNPLSFHEAINRLEVKLEYLRKQKLVVDAERDLIKSKKRLANEYKRKASSESSEEEKSSPKRSRSKNLKRKTQKKSRKKAKKREHKSSSSSSSSPSRSGSRTKRRARLHNKPFSSQRQVASTAETPLSLEEPSPDQITGFSMIVERYMPKRDGQSPRRDRQSPRRERQSPRRDRQSPRRDRQSPRRDRQSPRRDRQLACRDRQSPRRDRQSPRCDRQSPRRDRQSPHRDRQSPRRDLQSSRCDRNSPHRHRYYSGRQQYSPHRDRYSPHRYRELPPTARSGNHYLQSSSSSKEYSPEPTRSSNRFAPNTVALNENLIVRRMEKLITAAKNAILLEYNTKIRKKTKNYGESVTDADVQLIIAQIREVIETKLKTMSLAQPKTVEEIVDLYNSAYDADDTTLMDKLIEDVVTLNSKFMSGSSNARFTVIQSKKRSASPQKVNVDNNVIKKENTSQNVAHDNEISIQTADNEQNLIEKLVNQVINTERAGSTQTSEKLWGMVDEFLQDLKMDDFEQDESHSGSKKMRQMSLRKNKDSQFSEQNLSRDMPTAFTANTVQMNKDSSMSNNTENKLNLQDTGKDKPSTSNNIKTPDNEVYDVITTEGYAGILNKNNEVTSSVIVLKKEKLDFLNCVTNRDIPINTDFTESIKIIVRSMRHTIKKLKLPKDKYDKLTQTLKDSIDVELRNIFDGRPYMESPDIVEVFRLYHPKEDDRRYLSNILQQVNNETDLNGCSNKCDESTKNLAAIEYDNDVILVQNKLDVIEVPDDTPSVCKSNRSTTRSNIETYINETQNRPETDSSLAIKIKKEPEGSIFNNVEIICRPEDKQVLHNVVSIKQEPETSDILDNAPNEHGLDFEKTKETRKNGNQENINADKDIAMKAKTVLEISVIDNSIDNVTNINKHVQVQISAIDIKRELVDEGTDCDVNKIIKAEISKENREKPNIPRTDETIESIEQFLASEANNVK